MLDLTAYYDKMLAHCAEYLDSEGDNFLNLASTILGLNAYALTGDEKYRQWVLEYVGNWKQHAANLGGHDSEQHRTRRQAGRRPQRPMVERYLRLETSRSSMAELEKIAHRNYFTDGTWPGFGNALLLSGDQSFVDTLRKQMDLIYAQKKVENGRTLLPTMYGDPKGYKGTGAPSWYQYGPQLHHGSA
jgi:hypothetical protein